MIPLPERTFVVISSVVGIPARKDEPEQSRESGAFPTAISEEVRS
jgi:hypothetical protein